MFRYILPSKANITVPKNFGILFNSTTGGRIETLGRSVTKQYIVILIATKIKVFAIIDNGAKYLSLLKL